MLKQIKIEILYFVAILLGLALMQHSDLLTSPLARVNLMIEKGNYLHPILWTSVLYIVIGFIRVIVGYIFKLRSKK